MSAKGARSLRCMCHFRSLERWPRLRRGQYEAHHASRHHQAATTGTFWQHTRLFWRARNAPCVRWFDFRHPVGLNVYMRTNIELDDALVERAMRVYQVPTKRAVVELALRRLVDAMERKEKLEMEGSGWEGDLAGMRDEANPRPPVRKR